MNAKSNKSAKSTVKKTAKKAVASAKKMVPTKLKAAAEEATQGSEDISDLVSHAMEIGAKKLAEYGTKKILNVAKKIEHSVAKKLS